MLCYLIDIANLSVVTNVRIMYLVTVFYVTYAFICYLYTSVFDAELLQDKWCKLYIVQV